MEKQVLEEVYNFLAMFYYRGLNEKDWENCNKKMQEINQKYFCPFCSRMLGVAFYHIARLQRGETSPVWQGSEIQRYCQLRLKGA